MKIWTVAVFAAVMVLVGCEREPATLEERAQADAIQDTVVSDIESGRFAIATDECMPQAPDETPIARGGQRLSASDYSYDCVIDASASSGLWGLDARISAPQKSLLRSTEPDVHIVAAFDGEKMLDMYLLYPSEIAGHCHSLGGAAADIQKCVTRETHDRDVMLKFVRSHLKA